MAKLSVLSSKNPMIHAVCSNIFGTFLCFGVFFSKTPFHYLQLFFVVVTSEVLLKKGRLTVVTRFCRPLGDSENVL